MQAKIKSRAQWHTLYAMEGTALRNMVSSTGTPLGKPVLLPPYAVSSTGIALIPIVGPICKYDCPEDEDAGGTSTLQIQSNIQQALDDATVSSVLLVFDTPGGTVDGTPALADFIFESRSVKAINGYASDNCNSAGYWLLSQCNKIFANTNAMVGSIGVYHVSIDSSEAAKAKGLQITLEASGEFKGLDVPGIPISDKARLENKRHADSAAELFTLAVARGRNISMEDAKALSDGRVHIAAEAMQLGLIDEIGTLATAMLPQSGVQKMAEKAKAEAPPATTDAPAVDPTLNKILDALSALTAEVQKALLSKPAPEAKPAADPNAEKADDADPDMDAKAKASAMLKAFGAGREGEALKAFIAGKSPLQAKADLADALMAENAKLKKNADKDGIDPLAIGGAAETVETETDPEKVWAANKNKLQASYSGNKKYFLADFKAKASKLS
jgi:signal peptide peptidase SppA